MSSLSGGSAAGLPAVFNMREMRESLALAEQLARASISEQSSGKVQQLKTDNNNNKEGYVPPKQLLLYLVRYWRNFLFVEIREWCNTVTLIFSRRKFGFLSFCY